MNFKFCFILGLMFVGLTSCHRHRQHGSSHYLAQDRDFDELSDAAPVSTNSYGSQFMSAFNEASGILSNLIKKIFSNVRLTGLEALPT